MTFFSAAISPGGEFTLAPNHWARDPRLGLKDKGMLLYLAGHAPGYRLTVDQMIAESTDGRDAVYGILERLIKLDYVSRVQQRDETGKLGPVAYTWGPAAFEQRYDRAWPKRGVPAAQTTSGKSGSGTQSTASGKAVSGEPVSGEAVSGEPDTKKNKEKKTKGNNTTTPEPDPDDASGPSETGSEQVVEEEIGISEEQKVVATVLDALLAGVPAPRRPINGQMATLQGHVAQALAAGWQPADLIKSKSGGLETVTTVYGTLSWRLTAGLGDAPPVPQVPKQQGPCPHFCISGTITITSRDPHAEPAMRDRVIHCPRCHALALENQLARFRDSGVPVATFEELLAYYDRLLNPEMIES